jgi:hypothetical protein
VTTPALSVVVVRFAGGDAIQRTLAALRAQTAADRIEVIVGHGPSHPPAGTSERLYDPPRRDAAADGEPQAFGERWVAVPSDDPAVARAMAVRASRAPIVACTEDHCVPDAEWCARILDAHARWEAGAIGGAIDKTTPDDAEAWAAFLLEYGPFLPPLTAGPADRCSDCNVSYKRSALEAIAPVWSAAFRETSVHAALRDRGGLRIEPSMVVRQSRAIDRRAFGRERREHGRVYGAQVAMLRSPLARLVMAARTPLVPVVQLARARATLRARGRLAEVPGGTWPALARAAAAWAVGECVGLVTGRAS